MIDCAVVFALADIEAVAVVVETVAAGADVEVAVEKPDGVAGLAVVDDTVAVVGDDGHLGDDEDFGGMASSDYVVEFAVVADSEDAADSGGVVDSGGASSM